MELCSKKLFRHEEHRVSGTTHGDDFVVAGPTDSLAELNNKLGRGVPNQDKIPHLRANGEHQSIENEYALGTGRNCAPA